MTTHRTALAAAHVAALLFGLTGIFGALIRSGPAVITFGRAGFAILALAAFAALQRRSLWRDMDLLRLGTLAGTGVLLTLHWVTFFVAVKIGGVAVATLGFASFPAFIAVLDMLVFRERISAAEGLLLVFVTVGLVLVTPSFDLADQGTVGLIWGLASGLFFAMLAMANRRATRGVGAMQVAFWQNLTVALLLLPFAAGQLHGPEGPDTRDWLNLALLGVFCTGLSHYLFVKSLDRLSARSAGMIIALEPVYAIVAAWWLFHEQPSLRMLAGAALIVLAIVISARAPREDPQDTHAAR